MAKAAEQQDSTSHPVTPTAGTARAALKAADTRSALLAQIAKLPTLTGTGIDVAQQSALVRTHLDTVLRYYRSATTPVQKVGEPSDVLYAEQSQTEATQVATLAFEAAKYEAALLARVPGGAEAAKSPDADAAAGPTQSQRVNAIRQKAQQRLQTLQAQKTALDAALPKAKASQRKVLQQQEQQVDGGIELQQTMLDALERISTYTQAQAQTGLAGDIERLQRSAPELLSMPVKTPAPPVLQSLAAARQAGVTTQASVLFQLLRAVHTIDQQTTTIDALNKQIEGLRSPFLNVLRQTIEQGQQLTQQTVNLQQVPASNAPGPANIRQQFDDLSARFQVLSSAVLPLSQEAVLLENARGTLTTWRATVDAEYKDILKSLLIRCFFIALALGVLAIAGRMLNKAAITYVSDLRRRRQLLLIRRIVIGFLSGLVLIFGFVTQFSSLATFAGFITAGIAVGLQSILLSVAAYFFIVGRYGIRVGDRITVANVTGEVVEVGLVRFYMVELVGSGTELHSTGRVAVFANSILFQTGTPIYKQIPGTEYAWHELTAKLGSGADVAATSQAVLAVVNGVYQTYADKIAQQHQEVESSMGTALPAPKVECRLQLVEGGLQYVVLFPVLIGQAAEADQRIAEVTVQAMRADGPFKSGVAELPVIKAAVKS